MPIISSTQINKLKPNGGKQYDVRDSKLSGFMIRVNPSGSMTYICEYKRGKRIKIGRVGTLSPAQARDIAIDILRDAAKGIDPRASRNSSSQSAHMLRHFIENDYRAWVVANRKRGAETVTRIKRHFLKEFGDKMLLEITPFVIEKWRTKRFEGGKKSTTVNRDIAALKAAISKAVEWGIIGSNPIAKLKLTKIDSAQKVRYLTAEEELSLREALDVREQQIKAARLRGNLWRKERAYQELPNFLDQKFIDHIKPMILISLNTGLRRGELFNLTWENINFSLATISIVGETAKSGKTRHVPLNKEALQIFKDWRSQSLGNGLVFSNNIGKEFSTVKKSWATVLSLAKIENFRWHDMRHHFASRLVMARVDLNTVRELLGHTDIKMTLRYAHLAPEHKAEAVARLNNPW